MCVVSLYPHQSHEHTKSLRLHTVHHADFCPLHHADFHGVLFLTTYPHTNSRKKTQKALCDCGDLRWVLLWILWNYMIWFRCFHANCKKTHKVPYDCVAFCDPVRQWRAMTKAFFDFEGLRKRPFGVFMRMEMELLVIGNNLPLGGKLVPIALYILEVCLGCILLDQNGPGDFSRIGMRFWLGN